MSNPHATEKFKTQVVNQVAKKKLPVADLAARLNRLCAWIKRYSTPQKTRQYGDDRHAERRRLRAAYWVTKERNILKKPPRTLPGCMVEGRLYQAVRGRLFNSLALPDAESPS